MTWQPARAGGRDDARAGDLARALGRPLRDARDLDPLLERIGAARIVLLGEASHGTAEYYTWRAAITRRLVLEKGFSFLAVEGDWPDGRRLDDYVKGRAGASARQVLQGFARWPTWMWANEEVAALAEWLRRHNDRQPEPRKVGFYGLDVYSLWDSLRRVLDYARRHDPATLAQARRALACFAPFGEDAQAYARAVHWEDRSCEEEVVGLLQSLRRPATRPATLPTTLEDAADGDAAFDAEQNALVARSAERYYRTMVRGGPEAWNGRDRHMAETLDRLLAHHGAGAKAIVWAHNTHVGDARFTDMAEAGMLNLGELVREQHAAEGVVLVGFGSYRGTVLAGREWEAPVERMPLPPARPGSWEDVLHRALGGDALFLLDAATAAPELLAPRGHRAIGVVYHPERELGNYVPTVWPRRYDAFAFLDTSRALHPLRAVARRVREAPETFPSGV